MPTGLERIAEIQRPQVFLSYQELATPRDSVKPRLKSSVREIRTLGSGGVGLLKVSSPSTRRRGSEEPLLLYGAMMARTAFKSAPSSSSAKLVAPNRCIW